MNRRKVLPDRLRGENTKLRYNFLSHIRSKSYKDIMRNSSRHLCKRDNRVGIARKRTYKFNLITYLYRMFTTIIAGKIHRDSSCSGEVVCLSFDLHLVTKYSRESLIVSKRNSHDSSRALSGKCPSITDGISRIDLLETDHFGGDTHDAFEWLVGRSKRISISERIPSIQTLSRSSRSKVGIVELCYACAISDVLVARRKSCLLNKNSHFFEEIYLGVHISSINIIRVCKV